MRKLKLKENIVVLTPEPENEPAWYREVEALVTVSDAAEVLQVHRETIYRWIRDGRLQAFKIGHAWRIPKESLQCLNPQTPTSR